jgi:hypothetical protein
VVPGFKIGDGGAAGHARGSGTNTLDDEFPRWGKRFNASSRDPRFES